MKKATCEWVDKAEGDFRTAGRELQAKPPNYDATAFHSHQCVEKYLKARLIEAGAGFPKTHDLTSLLDLLSKIEPSWTTIRESLDALASLGVEVRYPGMSADLEDAENALKAAKKVRSLVRSSLK